VCIGVCACARACVIHGRRVLGLPGSPSALSAQSAWVPNMSSYMPASAPGNVQKKKPRALNKTVSKVLVMECALFAFKLALCLGMLAFSIRIIQDQVSSQ